MGMTAGSNWLPDSVMNFSFSEQHTMKVVR
jgi:hypothetical protein